MSFHDSVKNFFFQNTKLKYFSPQNIEFKNQDDLEDDFPGLRNHCSLIDLSGLCNLIGLNSLYSLIFWKNFLIPMVWSSRHQNDQYWSFFVEWFIKNLNFPWYMAPFLSEAVEASLCYFFENWWMKLKCHNLRNTQISSNKI